MECAYLEPEAWVTFSKNLLIVRGGCVYLWRGLGGTLSMAAIVVFTSCPTCHSKGVDCTCERLASADVAVVDCQATKALVNPLVAELCSTERKKSVSAAAAGDVGPVPPWPPCIRP
jgi:hypothetical protein